MVPSQLGGSTPAGVVSCCVVSGNGIFIFFIFCFLFCLLVAAFVVRVKVQDSPKGKITISTLAKMSGVSRATVSRVLNDHASVNEEARAKVMAAVKQSGYCRSLPRNRIALRFTQVTIISDEHTPFVEGSYLDIILRVLRDEAEHLGVSCNFVGRDLALDRKRLAEVLSKAQAVIMVGSDNLELIAQVKSYQLPTVIFNGSDPKMELNSLSPDSENGMMLLGNYLIAHGHTKACILNAHIKHAMRERSYGFAHAFDEAGVPFDRARQIIDLCAIAPLVDPSGVLYHQLMSRQAGVDFGASKMLPYLLDHNYFEGMTAIACVCDATAISLIKELQSRGIKVPEDISVTGFDDIVLASMMSPALTTIHIDFQNMAKTAFSMLIRSASGSFPMPLRAYSAVTIKERASVRNLNLAHANSN